MRSSRQTPALVTHSRLERSQQVHRIRAGLLTITYPKLMRRSPSGLAQNRQLPVETAPDRGLCHTSEMFRKRALIREFRYALLPLHAQAPAPIIGCHI